MNNYLTIKELPISERPYEKCEMIGPSVLTDAELLAVILRTGTKNLTAVDLAINILNHSSIYNGLNIINYLTMNELMKINGIGRVKAIQLLCIAELSKRLSKAIHKNGLKFTSPQNIANYYMQDMRHLMKEQVLLIMLDSKNRFIKDMIISQGTVNASLMPTREIFINALKNDSVNIILVHNHPSGDPTPSPEDINVTSKIKEAGTLIGIILMDHIIIGDNIYISLREQGLF